MDANRAYLQDMQYSHSFCWKVYFYIQNELLVRGFVVGVVGALAFLHNPQPPLHSKSLNPQVQAKGASIHFGHQI